MRPSDRAARASAAIETTGLTVQRGDTVALDGLAVSAPAGAVTALLGPNGAGKTTLARTIATLQPYSGSVRVDGIEVASDPHAVRDRVGVVGQHTTLPDRHTAAEYLRVVARLRGLGRRDADGAVGATIERSGLGPFVTRRLGRCSGGQRRRVALAASLVGDPSIIVLDEPTTGLDPHSRVGMWAQVDQLRRDQVSILLTTQDLDEAAQLADHVVILDRGHSVTAGSLDQLRGAQRLRRLTVVFDGAGHAPSQASLGRALGVDHDGDGPRSTFVGEFDPSAVHRALADTGVLEHVAELHLEPPTLEEIYRNVLDATDGAPA